MTAAEGQEHADLSADTEGGHRDFLHRRAALRQQLLNTGTRELQREIVAHALGAVARDRVRNFVRKDDGQAGIVACDRQDPRVNGDLASRQAKGVGALGFIEQRELPLEPGLVRRVGDAAADPHHTLVLGTAADDARLR